MEEDKHADAAYRCGLAYLLGLNMVVIDERKGVTVLRRAVELGAPYAHSMLTECTELGLGVERDEAEARRMLTEDSRDIYGTLMVARRERDVEQKLSESVFTREAAALSVLRQEAEAGDVRAQITLGKIYRIGSHDVSTDQSECDRWWLAAAAQGSAIAQRSMGVRAELGTNGPIDIPKAVEWYRLAAAQGEGEAQCYLAECYLNGVGCERSEVNAKMWLTKAAATAHDVGRSRAQTLLQRIAAAAAVAAAPDVL